MFVHEQFSNGKDQGWWQDTLDERDTSRGHVIKIRKQRSQRHSESSIITMDKLTRSASFSTIISTARSMVIALVSITRSGFAGGSYGASIPVKPIDEIQWADGDMSGSTDLWAIHCVLSDTSLWRLVFRRRTKVYWQRLQWMEYPLPRGVSEHFLDPRERSWTHSCRWERASYFFERTDERDNAHQTSISKKLSHFGNASNVLHPIRFREAKILIQATANIIAIQTVSR